MKIFFKLFLLWNIIVLNNANNAKLHRQPIHRHKGPFKTMGNILAEEMHTAKKFKFELNQHSVVANMNSINSTFYSYIFIGTPPQKLKVSFATAFGVLAVPSNQYYSNLSTTSLQEFHQYAYVGVDEYYYSVTYSDDEVRDNVQLADLVIPGQAVYSFNGFEQGIFGLGLSAPLVYRGMEMYPTPMQSLYNQKILPEDKFSMYLVGDSDIVKTEYGGEVIFGGSDPTLYSGNLTYTDVILNEYEWAIQVDAITISGEPIYQNFTAVLDSGTDFFVFPLIVYATVNRLLNGTFESGGHYKVDCNAIDSFPDIEFTVAGKNITVEPSAYILKYFGINGSIECMSSFYFTTSDNFILGTPFMTQQYFEFDGFNSKVGFAPLVPYTGSTNPLPTVPQNILPKKVCKTR